MPRNFMMLGRMLQSGRGKRKSIARLSKLSGMRKRSGRSRRQPQQELQSSSSQGRKKLLSQLQWPLGRPIARLKSSQRQSRRPNWPGIVNAWLKRP